jgi:hypothetical protein
MICFAMRDKIRSYSAMLSSMREQRAPANHQHIAEPEVVKNSSAQKLCGAGHLYFVGR